MFKKLKNKMVLSSLMVLSSISFCFADAATPKSMLSAETKALVQDFAADIVPTVLDLLVLLVPVGLTLWGIGFSVKKGINFLQKKASKAL